MEYIYASMVILVFLAIYGASLWLGRPQKLTKVQSEPSTDFFDWRNATRNR